MFDTTDWENNYFMLSFDPDYAELIGDDTIKLPRQMVAVNGLPNQEASPVFITSRSSMKTIAIQAIKLSR